MLPSDLKCTEDHIPAVRFTHDPRVNPRNPSDTWARKRLDSYNTALLGVFIVSERTVPGESGEDTRTELAILDGSNRVALMKLAGDEERPVLCNVFHGLSLPEEAMVAREYNERRAWTGVRIFHSNCTAGDPVACRIRDILADSGWAVGTTSTPGIIRGIRPFEGLIRTAGMLNIAEVKAARGSQQWRAATESGKDDAFRVMQEAVSIYTAAFPSRPSGYAADIIYGISLVLLKYGTKVNLERMTTQIREVSHGERFIVSDARGISKTMRFSFADAIAFLTIKFYNAGLAGNSRARLDENWVKTAR